jgi:hypothetical protein
MVRRHAGGPQSFVTRRIGGETLIVPVAGQVTDLESIYVLNEVAGRIWDLLQSPTTADTIATVVAGEFSVSPQHAVEDVMKFLDTLGARGLIEQVAEGAS